MVAGPGGEREDLLRRGVDDPGCLHHASLAAHGDQPRRTLAACGSVSAGCREAGQVVQGVAEVVWGERRELDVLAEELRHRRPVVGKPYLGLGLADRGEVVAPGPAAELQGAVACDVLAWLPGDGARRVAGQNLAGHLVVLVRVVAVVHGHPEDLAWRGQVLVIERLPIGAGGMGEVYLARDARLDRTVTIKILPHHLSDDATRRQRFEPEAKVVSSLNHPHICTLHDVGRQDGVDFIVMEFLEGESLAARLEKGPLPVAQVLQYGTQIASALDKAHRSGVTHRDLKPGNIM